MNALINNTKLPRYHVKLRKEGNMNLSQKHKRVLSLIPRGLHPRKVSEIAVLANLESRVVHEIISSLAIEFCVPIGSIRSGSHPGVFIATCEDERRIGIEGMANQTNEMVKRVSSVKKADLAGWESDLVNSIGDISYQQNSREGDEFPIQQRLNI